MKRLILLCCLSLIAVSIIPFNAAEAQQQLTPVRESQAVSVTQRIGLTDIIINYHSPMVKDREVWGKLVPYNVVWRAGANENTTISFSDNISIGGAEIPAGTYGVHMIPKENEWILILSKNHWSWGSFFYNENEDQARIKISAQPAEFQEWLSYSFENPTANSVDAVLRWEKMKVIIPISLNVNEIVLNHYLKELNSIPGFFWQGWNQAAWYALQNDTRTDEAMAWVDRSINTNRNFTNLMTKHGLLVKADKTSEAEEMKKEAYSLATENEVNTYGYQLLGAKKFDEAIEVFTWNINTYPESWNVYDSLAEAYQLKGDAKLAKEYYTKALGMAPESQKKRISQVLLMLD
jgi:tetratricopeptide (TPR) repeat protein